uniref:Uncharacterized protein n=1 Tax=Rhodopseudomonas palustris (strain DX-1) TaxID=652103 RepID=E6VFM0_RHOPX
MGAYQENYGAIDWSKEIPMPRRARPDVTAQRSDFPCPRIASDVMEPVQSQLDGKIYDSKSALRRTYRAAGVIEVGNDPARLKPRKRQKVDDKAIAEAVDKAAARVERGERSLYPGK